MTARVTRSLEGAGPRDRRATLRRTRLRLLLPYLNLMAQNIAHCIRNARMQYTHAGHCILAFRLHKALRMRRAQLETKRISRSMHASRADCAEYYALDAISWNACSALRCSECGSGATENGSDTLCIILIIISIAAVTVTVLMTVIIHNLNTQQYIRCAPLRGRRRRWCGCRRRWRSDTLCIMRIYII